MLARASLSDGMVVMMVGTGIEPWSYPCQRSPRNRSQGGAGQRDRTLVCLP